MTFWDTQSKMVIVKITDEMKEIADLIVTTLKKSGDNKTEKEMRDRVHKLTKGFPVPGLGSF